MKKKNREPTVRVIGSDGVEEDMVLHTKSGRLVTMEDLERWADEAEAGYDVSQLKVQQMAPGLTEGLTMLADNFGPRGVIQTAIQMWPQPDIVPATERSLVVLLYECFKHFYHLDWSNAAVHMAPVRYSPITFRLAEEVSERFSATEVVSNTVYPDVHSVLLDKGVYVEDPGR